MPPNLEPVTTSPEYDPYGPTSTPDPESLMWMRKKPRLQWFQYVIWGLCLVLFLLVVAEVCIAIGLLLRL